MAVSVWILTEVLDANVWKVTPEVNVRTVLIVTSQTLMENPAIEAVVCRSKEFRNLCQKNCQIQLLDLTDS